MRRLINPIVLFLLTLQISFAGVNRNQAKVSGGSTSQPPVNSAGFLEMTEPTQLTFRYKAGKNDQVGQFAAGSFDLPYQHMSRLVYTDVKHLRIGQTIALSALAGVGGLLLLLSKSHRHYILIDYRDAADKDQVISFEVGKDAIRPLIESLEIRTGKKVEYEFPARKPQTK